MKKHLILLLVVCVIFLTACSNNKTSSSLPINTESMSGTQTSENSSDLSDSEMESSEQDSLTNSDTDPGQTADASSGTGGGTNSTGNNTAGNTPSSKSAESQNPTSKQPSPPSQPANIAVTGISLNKSFATLEINGTVTLTEAVSPSNATDKSVTWSSDSKGVAVVDSTGTVTAKSAGTATITAKTVNGKTASCTVKVNAPVVKFDVETYKQYAITYGESIGLIHYVGLGSNSWNAWTNLYPALSDETMKKNIRGSLHNLKELDGATHFEVFLEKVKDNDYRLYLYYS